VTRTPDDVLNDLEHVTVEVAAKVCAKYGRFIERADVEQEIRLWIYTNFGRVADQLEGADFGTPAERAGHINRVAGWMRRVALKAARAARASAVGYDPDDEYHYTPAVIAKLLPIVITGRREKDADTENRESTSKPDPATGNDFEAFLADVRHAWYSAPDPLLYQIYSEPGQVDRADLATRWGVSLATIYRRETRALQRMADTLGADNE